MLDADPDLGAGLDPAALGAARTRAVAAMLQVESGPCVLSDHLPDLGPMDSLLLLDGTLTREVRVRRRVFTELVGPGDVLRPREHEEVELLPCEVEWHALTPTALALLDSSFHDRVRAWPQITSALVARALRRSHRLALQRALSCHKRLEERILMLFWHLAERWGRVGPEATVRLRLPLTHKLIGEIVGAERPSVSATLGRLAASGKLVRSDEDWVLHGSVGGRFGVQQAGAEDDDGSEPVLLAADS